MIFIPGALGADMSFYQDDDRTPQKIDFAKMKAAGVKFVFLRGGQNSWVDEDFRDYINAVKTTGLPWGSYWFYDPRTAPQIQAQKWREACGADVPRVIAIDLEFPASWGGNYTAERFWKEFVEECKARFPLSKVVIYTANWWWSGRITDNAYWSALPLWVAQYISDPASVTLPAPWRNKQAHIWQFTSSGDGAKYGVESAEIDLNYWNNYFDFSSWWGGAPSDPVPPPPTGGTMAKYECIVDSLAIRTGPSTTYASAGYVLKLGDKVDAVKDAASGWLKISKIYRAGGNQLTPPAGIAWWCSGLAQYMKPLDVVTPPPPPPPPPPAPVPDHVVEVFVDGVSVYRKELFDG